MDGMLWWSHLTPVLPSYVSDPLEGAQARLLGLLNLSLVFGVIACEAVVVLGLVGQQWTAALGVAVAGGVLAWLGYHAAVSQALEVTSQIRVAFNLYRQEILKQMGLAIPKTVAEERALWQTLTQELLGLSTAAAPTGDGTETAAAPRRQATEPAVRANGEATSQVMERHETQPSPRSPATTGVRSAPGPSASEQYTQPATTWFHATLDAAFG